MAPIGPRADPPADYRDRLETLTGQSLRACPHCHTGIMVVIDCITRPGVCPAGSGHIMIPDRPSCPMTPTPPPNRDRYACATAATSTPKQASNGQIEAATVTAKVRLAWRTALNRRSKWSDHAVAMDPKPINPHSHDGGGERLSPTRFSLTGADSSRGAPGGGCAPRRQAKNAVRYAVVLMSA